MALLRGKLILSTMERSGEKRRKYDRQNVCTLSEIGFYRRQYYKVGWFLFCFCLYEEQGRFYPFHNCRTSRTGKFICSL